MFGHYLLLLSILFGLKQIQSYTQLLIILIQQLKYIKYLYKSINQRLINQLLIIAETQIKTMQNHFSQIPQIKLLKLSPLIDSISSQTSISNFIAQTPKDNRQTFNFQKSQKSQRQNQENKQNNIINANKNYEIPFKMVNSQTYKNCTNHLDKQSKYFVQTQMDNIFYCQKCAILTASQGFRVNKIQNNFTYQSLSHQNYLQFHKHRQQPYMNSQQTHMHYQQTHRQYQQSLNSQSYGNNDLYNNQFAKNRPKAIKSTQMSNITIKKNKLINQVLKKEVKQKQLTNFLNKIQRMQLKIQKLQKKTSQRIHHQNITKQKQRKQINYLFKNLHKILNDYENQIISQINSQTYQEIKLQTYLKNINNDIETLDDMKIDISQAYDDIINITTNQQFQTVINQYKSNIKIIQSGCQQAYNFFHSQNNIKIQQQNNIKVQQQTNQNVQQQTNHKALQQNNHKALQQNNHQVQQQNNHKFLQLLTKMYICKQLTKSKTQKICSKITKQISGFLNNQQSNSTKRLSLTRFSLSRNKSPMIQ